MVGRRCLITAVRMSLRLASQPFFSTLFFVSTSFLHSFSSLTRLYHESVKLNKLLSFGPEFFRRTFALFEAFSFVIVKNKNSQCMKQLFNNYCSPNINKNHLLYINRKNFTTTAVTKALTLDCATMTVLLL